MIIRACNETNLRNFAKNFEEKFNQCHSYIHYYNRKIKTSQKLKYKL